MKKKLASSLVLFLICYQFYLFVVNEGNFRVHVEYCPYATAEHQVDFLIKLNGETILSDTFCIDKTLIVDSVYLFPLGVNTLEYSSKKMKYYNKKTIVNFIFLSNYIELYDELIIKNNRLDSIKTFPVLYFYPLSRVDLI